MCIRGKANASPPPFEITQPQPILHFYLSDSLHIFMGVFHSHIFQDFPLSRSLALSSFIIHAISFSRIILYSIYLPFHSNKCICSEFKATNVCLIKLQYTHTYTHTLVGTCPFTHMQIYLIFNFRHILSINTYMTEKDSIYCERQRGL